MKFCLYVAFALVVVTGMTASASADDNHFSTGTLSAVGLPGFTPMSDAQAMTVRGKFAAVGGVEVATAPGGAFAANGYLAVGHSSAVGGAGSIAVSGIGSSSGHFIVAGSIAAGGAFAAAH